MITETFLNKCFEFIFNKYSPINKNPKFYSDILNILENWKKSNQIGVIGQNKFDFLVLVIKKILTGEIKERALEGINYEGRFGEINDFILITINKNLEEEDFIEISKTLDEARMDVFAFQNIPMLEELIDMYKNNNNDTKKEFHSLQENAITTLYKNYTEAKMMESNNKTANFSYINGKMNNLDAIFEGMVRTYDPENKIPTGFQILDDNVLMGGFAKKNVYVFAGATKSGKSTLLCNLFINSVCRNYREKLFFMYISLENTLEQLGYRFGCALLNITQAEYTIRLKANKKTEVQIVEDIFNKYSNNYDFIYRPAKTFSINDIYSYLISTQQANPEYKLGGIYIDYLNHISPSNKKIELRHQLGETIQELSNMAIKFDIPVITATQLNRIKPKVSNPIELSISATGESHGINMNTDSLFLMAQDIRDNKIVHFNSGVQRNGVSGELLTFEVDFKRFKFKKLKYWEDEGKRFDNTGYSGDGVMTMDIKKKLDGGEDVIKPTKKSEGFFLEDDGNIL